MKPYAWIILLQSCTKPSIWGYTVNIVVWVQSSRKWLHVPCNDYYHNYHYNETNDESGCSVVTPFLRQKPGWPFWKPFNTLSIRLISKPIVCMCVCVVCACVPKHIKISFALTVVCRDADKNVRIWMGFNHQAPIFLTWFNFKPNRNN